MGVHTVAFSGSISNSSGQNPPPIDLNSSVPAISDGILTLSNQRILTRMPMWLIGAEARSTTFYKARVTPPSRRAVSPPYMQGRCPVARPGSIGSPSGLERSP